jgi:hypothetical protein
MSRFSFILRRILTALVLLMFFIPILQDKFAFAKLEPLKGAITYPTKDTITAAGWFSGTFQEKTETFLKEMFGFRSFCVRLNNQILYSVFSKTNAQGIVIGKNGYLFESGYLDTYTGKDCIGKDSAEIIARRMKFISEALAREQKQLIIVIAAGKASFYPEYIPDRFPKEESCSNYKLFSESLKGKGLNVLDINGWFMAEKNKSKYPLYPQYGIHWSSYGAVLVADTIIKTIEHLRGIDMPNLYYDSLRMEQPHGIDYDIADGLNLLRQLKSFDMAYVDVKCERPEGKTQPNVLVISDSFYWGMYAFGIGGSFKKHHFWYYNQQVYPESFTEEKAVKELSLRKELDNHDVVIIMGTESNLKTFSWGFNETAEKLLQTHVQPHSEKYRKKLKELVEYIKVDGVWLEATIKNAKKEGRSLEEQLIKEAEWVLAGEGLY